MLLGAACLLSGCTTKAPGKPAPVASVGSPAEVPASSEDPRFAGTVAVPPQPAPVAVTPTTLLPAAIEQMLSLALDCVHQEYPNVLLHQLQSAADARPPQALHPAFYGCFDWHSAVHGHWLLTRLARLYPDHPLAPAAREALFVSLTAANVEAELDYFKQEGRRSFERPYGLAWLLQLDLELAEWADAGEPLADTLRRNLEGLVDRAVENLEVWLPQLTYPIRTGTHSQTAFALSLYWDWASYTQRVNDLTLIRTHSERLYQDDVDCPISYEPSGHDFFSPCLAEADLQRRLLPPFEFARWLSDFLPAVADPSATGAASNWLRVAIVTDPTDGHLVHLDGLNLSRAWMLEGVASGLPADDPRRNLLINAAAEHQQAGLESLIDPHYAGGHWLGSFATYLLSQRGLAHDLHP